jgi:glycosyltransferase involved in cell wall biosynthesis
MTLRYLESFCVWNLYKCTTQSGVLPKAFMTGTPVIANSLGSFPDFIRNGLNGEIVDDSRNFEAILRASERIRKNFETYARGCRRSFVCV